MSYQLDRIALNRKLTDLCVQIKPFIMNGSSASIANKAGISSSTINIMRRVTDDIGRSLSFEAIGRVLVSIYEAPKLHLKVGGFQFFVSGKSNKEIVEYLKECLVEYRQNQGIVSDFAVSRKTGIPCNFFTALNQEDTASIRLNSLLSVFECIGHNWEFVLCDNPTIDAVMKDVTLTDSDTPHSDFFNTIRESCVANVSNYNLSDSFLQITTGYDNNVIRNFLDGTTTNPSFPVVMAIAKACQLSIGFTIR